MVAPRALMLAPDPETAPDFSHYDAQVDRSLAGLEGGPGAVTFVPLILHPSFSPQRRVTKAERRECLIRQAAIRFVAGLEPRSLRDVAEEIGCGHTTIVKNVHRICERLGMRPVRISEATREKLRAARRRRDAN